MIHTIKSSDKIMTLYRGGREIELPLSEPAPSSTRLTEYKNVYPSAQFSFFPWETGKVCGRRRAN